MNKCPFNPEIVSVSSDVDKLIACPNCGHLVIVGLPHPDFSDVTLPVKEDLLVSLALGYFTRV